MRKFRWITFSSSLISAVSHNNITVLQVLTATLVQHDKTSEGILLSTDKIWSYGVVLVLDTITITVRLEGKFWLIHEFWEIFWWVLLTEFAD